MQAGGVDPKQFETWDGLLTASRTLTKPSGDTFSQIGFVYPGAGFTDWHTINGGELLSKDGRKVAFNTATGRETLTYMTESVQRVYGTREKLAAFIDEYKAGARQGRPAEEGAWFAQKIAVRASGPWEWVETPQYAPQLQMGAARMPANKANPRSKQTTLAEGIWTWAMGAGLKRPDEAWLLEKWISLEDGHREFMISMGRATMVRKVAQDKAYYDKNPGWNLVLETINAATPLPQSKGWGRVKSIANGMVGDVLAGKTGVDAALKEAAEKAQVELDQAYRQS